MDKENNDLHRLKVLNVYELADLLGMTSAAVRSHWQRRNFEAIPKPVHFGRRLGWPVSAVEVWLNQKINLQTTLK